MGKITSIIFIYANFFTKRDYERFGIQYFIDKGYEVKLLDCTPLCFPEYYELATMKGNMQFSFRYNIFSKEQLQIHLENTKEDVHVVNITFYRKETHPIYEMISKFNIHYSTMQLGILPEKRTTLYYIKSYLKKKIPTIFMRLFYNISNNNQIYLTSEVLNIKGLKYSDVAIFSGIKCLEYENNPLFGRNTLYLWCHTNDYDNYLISLNKNMQQLNQEKYFVFLDEYFVFHPELKLYQNNILYKILFSKEEYYGSLCKFFNYIEQSTGMKVIICAHPKAEYDDKPELFEGRKIVYFQTSDYVMNSSGVLMHCSTSINYAILNKKPIIFMSHSKLIGTVWQSFIEAMASYLTFSPITLDDESTYHLGLNLEINNEAYEKYIDDFIIHRKNDREKFSWEIIEEYISSIEI